MDWKVGDWAVFDRRIVQIKKIDDYCEVSDGSINTSGNLADRLRPLTLRNKATAECFDWYYTELRTINGERGFNYPAIHNYFNDLCLQAIDGPENNKEPYTQAQEFLQKARDYTPEIDGVKLFRAA